MMRKLMSVILVSCLLVTFLFLGKENIPPVQASPDIYQGDLVLAGNNVTVIEGRFDINGSIIVEENATLILRNAVINFTQAHDWQFQIILQNPADGSPSLQSENTTITSSQDHWFFVSFFDNSTATISDSTVTAYLNIQDSAIASVSDSETKFLVASQSSFVSVFNCTISDTLRTNNSPKVLVSNSTIALLNLGLNSVNCSAANFGSGLFPFWNFVLNCSATISPGGFAPNITIIQSTISDWQLSISGKSNATITDSTIGILFSFGHTTVWLVNSTALYIQYSMEGKIYVSWYLDVHVTDSIDQNVPSANVTATYPNATVAESKLADANGWERFTLMEKMMNATGEYPVGNYTVEATYNIYSDVTTVNMTENQQITLTLADFVIPEFPSFLILPLFMITTLLAVIVYRRKHSM